MKKRIISFIVCISCLGCVELDWGDSSLGPNGPERYQEYTHYGAQFVVLDSITGLTIANSVWIFNSDSTKYSVYQNGEITVIISVRTLEQEYPDKTIMVSKAFWADGYERTNIIQYMFHDDPHKYPTHYIKLKPM